MRVLLHKLLHDHDAWVALLLDAEEELELGEWKKKETCHCYFRYSETALPSPNRDQNVPLLFPCMFSLLVDTPTRYTGTTVGQNVFPSLASPRNITSPSPVINQHRFILPSTSSPSCPASRIIRSCSMHYSSRNFATWHIKTIFLLPGNGMACIISCIYEV